MKTFFKIDQISSIILRILTTNFSKQIRNDFLNLSTSLVSMLLEFSTNDYGRQLILENFDTNK